MSEMYEPLSHYLRETAGLSSSQFLLGHNCPVLLWSQSLDWVQADAFQFATTIIDLASDKAFSPPAETKSQMAKTLVIEVQKQPGSASSGSWGLCGG